MVCTVLRESPDRESDFMSGWRAFSGKRKKRVVELYGDMSRK